MSWIPLEPSRSNGYKKVKQSAITLTAAGGTKQRRRIIVTIRPHLIEAPPAFLKEGAMVAPLLGEGEHAGYMRIRPGGTTMITVTGGSGRRGRPSLQITLQEFPGIASGQYRGTPPLDDDWEHSDDWIEFKLPAWAVGQDAVTEPGKATTPEEEMHIAAIGPEHERARAKAPTSKAKPEAKKAA